MAYQLFEKAVLGPLELQSRILRSATNEHLSASNGDVTEALIEAYAELAGSGVGLIITGHYTVDRNNRNDVGQPIMDDAVDKGRLRQLTQVVHENGNKVAAQISHTGLKAPEELNGHPALAPADLSEEEIRLTVGRFIRAAEIARETGFDGVQVHTAHGYFLSNFLDPHQNTRTDAYGGCIENRFRIVGEILEGVRAACGRDFLLLVKANCNESSLSLNYHEDFAETLRLCEQAGADAVEVSGQDFAQMPPSVDEPYYLKELLAARNTCGIPLILVGGLDSRAKLEMVLTAGVPFVSLSRSLILDPDFVNKLRTGQAEKTSCLRCNACYQIFRKTFTRCTQHRQEIPQLRELFSEGN